MATLDTLAAFDALCSRPSDSAFPQLDLRNGHVVLAFDDVIDESTDFVGFLPANYSGVGLHLLLTWTSATATAGQARWSIAFERHPIGDATHGTFDLDTDSFAAAVEVDATSPIASGELVRTSLTISSAQANNPEAGESFRLRIGRTAANAGDTMTGDAELVLLEVREL